MATPEPMLLKPAEVAQILRVSTRTVRRYAADGRLPCRRVGPMGLLRFDVKDLAAFLVPQ